MSTAFIHASYTTAEAFALIFKNLISTSTVSFLWKMSNMMPIFKKGSKLKVGNYRPVLLTCVLCKVMEAFIHD